jgi:two-component system CheB/CheR fusion protein
MDEAFQQRRRRLAFDLGPIAELVIDASGTVRMANQRARDLLGIPPDDLGKPLLSLACSRRPVPLGPMIERAASTGRGDAVRGVPTRTPDGEDLIVDVQVISLPSDDGSLGTIVTFTDVTGLHQTLADVERTERASRTAIDELRLTRAQLERISEDLRGSETDLKLTSEELRSSTEELEITGAELSSGNEELARTSDELAHRTSELSLAERLMHSVFDTLGAAFVLDDELSVRLWSSECEELWGVHHGEVRGRRLRDIQLGLPVRALEALVRSVQEGGEPAEAVMEAEDREGGRFPCRVAASLLSPGATDRKDVVVIVRRDPVVG